MLVFLPWLIVKKTLPAVEIAAIIDIEGSLKAFETKILFLACTHPLRLESEVLIILSSMLNTSVPAERMSMYSFAATYLIKRFLCESYCSPTTPRTR